MQCAVRAVLGGAGLSSCTQTRYLLYRSLFSKTGQWEKEYTHDKKLELEEYWMDRLRDQHRLSEHSVDKPKHYVLSMFPYPSGQLHMGHVRVYTISDAMARYHRLAGKQVIHPMGWDAFGLPAENAAIERGELPEKWTRSNIEHMRKQLDGLGCSFDWDREYATCDPAYYKWTQYIFLKMFEAGLVYQKLAAVNWDPVDQTVLADEQIDENGVSWRSGVKAERRFLKQWYIKTTAYSKSLHDGLEEVDPALWDDVISLQRAWIGECNGTRIEFKLTHESSSFDAPLSVFTQTPEAIYGVSHILLSPEHYLNHSQYYKVEDDSSEDIELTVQAVHPFTHKAVPIFISKSKDFGMYLDSVLGIPSCSEEDKGFADALNLPYTHVIDRSEEDKETLINSQQFSGLDRKLGFQKITEYAKEHKCGGEITSERGRDWLISRQRYWGTPIPIIHCPKHGAVAVPFEDLPVELPKVTEFTGKGASPLVKAEEWRKVKCSKCDCGGYGLRETDTMDTFVDSSWYYLRYLDPHNTQEPFSKEAVHANMPVDLYIGGKEHAIMHLYYARFFHHFLHDQGLVPTREPFVNLLTQGMVMGRSYRHKMSGRYLRPDQVNTSGKAAVEIGTGDEVIEDWEKMSKSKYNGVDPQRVMEEHGTDATRLCILSNVAPKSNRNWNEEAFIGVHRWQSRVWRLVHDYIQQSHLVSENIDPQLVAQNEVYIYENRNYFLKEANYHMESSFLLSVAISRLQGLSNALKRVPGAVMGESLQFERALADLVITLAPFAPMFASELWAGLQSVAQHPPHNWDRGVLVQKWPQVDSDYHMPLKVKCKSKDVCDITLPMTIGNEGSLTKQQALDLLLGQDNLNDLLNGAKVTDAYLILIPGFKAELHIKTIGGENKKKKKKKQQQ